MLARYVLRDLVRNPRRTAAALAGVTLGVGLFSGVLFFIDGSGASMTKRALAPLAIDLQRIMGAASGARLELVERLSPAAVVPAGGHVTVTLSAINRSSVPAGEVVVDDVPPDRLRYLTGTTKLAGRPVAEPRIGTPLSQGLAKLGLNVGRIPPGQTRTLTYVARTKASVDTRLVKLRGRISSREDPIPEAANAASGLSLDALAARVRAIPGVASADPLAFVDLPPGSVGVGSRMLTDTTRVFAFGEAYRRHYPSALVAAGSLRPGSVAVSVEAARALQASVGASLQINLPAGRGPLVRPIGGLTDLSRARPLFYSRRASDLEAFLYLPHSVVIDRSSFTGQIIPAFQAALGARNRITRTQPIQELDIRLNRSQLQSDPGTALGQARRIATAVDQLSPRGSYAIDNASNALQVARDDAAVAKRMFLFLGLPGALLAAFLTGYAGNILASTQRREQALLRIRGADGGHLLRMLVLRTLVLAGAGSLVGVALGLLAVTVILGPSTLFETSAAQLALTAVISAIVGMLATGLALYLPGRRALHREITQERAEIELAPMPAWRRYGLDVMLLLAVVAGEVIALRSGAFNAAPGSVYAGRAVSLPSYLLLAPLGVWIAGVMLSVRLFHAAASRSPLGLGAAFGTPVRGSLTRSLRRRSWSLAGGVAAVGLVIAFGTSLLMFTTTYDAGKAADARFTLGSDLRVTPSVLSTMPHPPAYASQLQVPGIADVTPVVYRPQNAVLTTAFNEDQKSLAAIDPAGFRRVGALSDRIFPGGSAGAALSALRRDPRGVLLTTTTADDLKVTVGDQVKVLFARGTARQTDVKARVVGLFDRFPGFPDGVDVISNLSRYESATHGTPADFFLARTSTPGAAGLAAASDALRRGPGSRDRLNVDTTRTTLNKDQSSLTALNVRGLVDLNALFTLLMAAAGIAMFVFGLMLSRRREYVTLRAQGLQTHELRALVLGETGVVTGFALVAGVLVGCAMGVLLVRVLQPLFVLGRDAAFSVAGTAVLAGLVVLAAVLSAVAATELLRRLNPTELLRET
jgi:putative ABC transport system permease protein